MKIGSLLRKDKIEKKYSELLMAVEMKYEGETRHETALRYIRQARSIQPEGEKIQASGLKTKKEC